MRRTIHTTMALCGFVAWAMMGCGAGNLASDVAKPPEFAPKDQTKCGVTKSQARPLIVEWPSSDRAALEASVKRGIVPVRYIGCEMEVLTRCQVSNSTYGYTGITRKSDHIVMHDADELYANIPVYAAKFEGKLQRSGALNVAMTIVGRYDANKLTVSKDELQGDCADATHVISALTVGAFEFFAGAESETGAGLDVMGLGAGAKSTSQHETLNRDGDEAACEKAAGNDTAPPFGCGALLRVEVVALGEARKDKPDCPSGTNWDGHQCVAVAAKKPETAEPVVKPQAPTATCNMGDVSGCTSMCNQGEQEACVVLGTMLKEGKGIAKNTTRAMTLLDGACTAGKMKGCVLAGEILYNVEPKDAKKAFSLFSKACDGGEPTGCVDMGWAHLSGTGTTKDAAQAAASFGKACTPTEAVGCVGLGQLYKDGNGVPRDRNRAADLFKKACESGLTVACKMTP